MAALVKKPQHSRLAGGSTHCGTALQRLLAPLNLGRARIRASALTSYRGGELRPSNLSFVKDRDNNVVMKTGRFLDKIPVWGFRVVCEMPYLTQPPTVRRPHRYLNDLHELP